MGQGHHHPVVGPTNEAWAHTLPVNALILLAITGLLFRGHLYSVIFTFYCKEFWPESTEIIFFFFFFFFLLSVHFLLCN